MITQVQTVGNVEAAKEAVAKLEREGYTKENLYVLAHEEERTESIADATGANKVGLIELGALQSVANLFRSEGETLRQKMRSLGVSAVEADRLEKELDEGRIVIIAWGGNLDYNEKHEDPNIVYHMAAVPHGIRGNRY